MNRRLFITASALGLVAVIGGASAFAGWTAMASGSGKASTLVVPQVTGVTAPNGTGSTTITWNASTFAPGVTGYLVQRYTNSTGTAGQATACANASTTSCTDSTVGTFWYGVTALYKPAGVNWAGLESSRAQATISVATAAGITLTNVTTDPSPSIKQASACTGAVGSRSCSSTNEDQTNGRVLAASLQLVDSSGAAFTNNSGAAVTIDLSIPNSGTGKDGSVSPTGSLTVANGSSTSGSFTLTRNNGSGKTVTLTATIHGTSKTLTITLAS